MKLIRLKEPLDLYHQRRADKHGWIYFDESPEFSGLVTARSMATGVICTFDKYYVELVDDDPQLQG